MGLPPSASDIQATNTSQHRSGAAEGNPLLLLPRASATSQLPGPAWGEIRGQRDAEGPVRAAFQGTLCNFCCSKAFSSGHLEVSCKLALIVPNCSHKSKSDLSAKAKCSAHKLLQHGFLHAEEGTLEKKN